MTFNELRKKVYLPKYESFAALQYSGFESYSVQTITLNKHLSKTVWTFTKGETRCCISARKIWQLGCTWSQDGVKLRTEGESNVSSFLLTRLRKTDDDREKTVYGTNPAEPRAGGYRRRQGYMLMRLSTHTHTHNPHVFDLTRQLWIN